MKLNIREAMMEYLQPSEVIDFDNYAVYQCAQSLIEGIDSELVRVQTMYEFVRDQINHTFDIAEDKCVITCKASDVLRHGQGVCYAKSHLLAALLRGVRIPAGFCYQKLIFSEVKPDLVLHGLNAVYLKSLDKWIRLDARGNKPGVDAQFALDQERLAFPVRKQMGETDSWEVYAVPSRNVIAALNVSNTRAELVDNLPTEV